MKSVHDRMTEARWSYDGSVYARITKRGAGVIMELYDPATGKYERHSARLTGAMAMRKCPTLDELAEMRKRGLPAPLDRPS